MDGKALGELSSIGVEQVNEFGERYFSNLNFNSFYKVSAQDLYEQDFDDLFKKNALYVIVGTDSGLFPKYIKHKGIPDGSRYIFIEPSAILSELLKAKVLNTTELNFAFTDENTWIEAIEAFKGEEYFYLNSVHINYAYCTKEDNLNIYMDLCWYVDEKIRQLHYEYRVTIGTEQFIVQQLLNLVDNQHPAMHLAGAFNGKTAFVLGGGPSLDEALPWLLKNRSWVVLLAASRISKRLLDLGIEPDFIISGDPFYLNYSVSKDIYNFSTKPILIHSCYVYHPLLSQWQGRSFYLDNRLFWNAAINEDNLISNPPTVSNAALGVALQMGFSQIFLAGVDLCFTKDGFTHAQGSNEYAAGARFNLTGIEVETYDHTKSPTALDYRFARDFLERQVQDIAPNRVYNISLHAAKIANIKYMPLSQITLDKKDIDINAIVTPLFIKNVNINYFHDLRQELNKALYQFKEIHKLATTALKYNNELYGEDGTIKDYRIKKKLDKIEKLLDHQYHDYSEIVKAFGLKQFIQFIKPHEEIKPLTSIDERIELAQELKERLDIYYNSFIDGSKNLIKIIERIHQILRAREEEQKAAPNWDLIIESCRAEQAYGRVYIWEQLESAKYLAAEHQKVFAEFKLKFAETLADAQTLVFQKIKKRNSLSLANHRASTLFKQKKLETLRNMLPALDKHFEADKVAPYHFLIQGYVAELENDKERALSYYQQVLEAGAGPLKEALLRIVHLDFQEQANEGLGHQALECLAQLDPRYLVFYAESCRIKGNVADAINLYIKYLAIFPGDWQSSLALAELFYQQKIYEGTALLLKQVLEKNPTQKSALLLKQKLDAVQG
ncbi:6-hydroxymethylpterin diphosphokinase MptE-like protein [Legionella sp. km772]|uniref:6-hydroxymethylpterin diphosphokinase MptE-like protein n=1 Tax=Legionella sp. km772 TaxID=2498111 RepID=UPI000F8C7D3F|nr:6-hydroxymethylpterin diphosphokinase MptE-like protein [Legionella sp. km772]RUR13997.1 DUF115 domain-containing protein [Legionella sp. km772]